MEFGTRLQRWWQRVRGVEPSVAKPVRPAAGKPVRAVALKTTQLPESDVGELSIEGDPQATQAGNKPRPRSAGFDPYSNAAGHAKPRGWDNVPRK